MIPLISLGFGILGAGFALGAWFWRVVVARPAAPPSPAAPPAPPVGASVELDGFTFTICAVDGPPVWVLAFGCDESGLWAVGRDRGEARRLSLGLWHRHTPQEERVLSDRVWLDGLRFVEIAASEDTLRAVVLPTIEGARSCSAPWGYPAAKVGA